MHFRTTRGKGMKTQISEGTHTQFMNASMNLKATNVHGMWTFVQRCINKPKLHHTLGYDVYYLYSLHLPSKYLSCIKIFSQHRTFVINSIFGCPLWIMYILELFAFFWWRITNLQLTNLLRSRKGALSFQLVVLCLACLETLIAALVFSASTCFLTCSILCTLEILHLTLYAIISSCASTW